MRARLPAWLALLLVLPGPSGAFDLSAEAVLEGAARLAWTPPPAALGYEIERRVPGGAWIPVGAPGASDTSFVDRPPGGAGLAPGVYEYRIRAETGAPPLWGDWSEPLVFERVEECAGQPPPPAWLPTVLVDDLDGDGFHTGQDVALALDACESLGGCVLEALPVTYDDVAIRIGSLAQGCPPHTLCGDWALPDGLVVQGHGSATVFRSPVFGPAPYDPSAVFDVRPGPGDLPIDGLRYRHFTIDGRKGDQPDPGTLSSTWRHDGISVYSPFGVSTDGGCVHGLHVHDVLKNAIALAHARGWIVEHNTVDDTGCHTERSPCASFTAATPPVNPQRPDTQSLGFGVDVLQRTEDTVVRHNEIRRAVKIGIQIKTDTSGFSVPPTPAEEAEIVRDFLVHDNRVSDSMGGGILVNSGLDGVIRDNRIEATTAPDYTGIQTAAGLVCGGWVERVTFRDNEVDGSGQEGIVAGCAGRDLALIDNLVTGSCRDVSVGQASLKVKAPFPSFGLRLEGNVVRDDPSGGCQYPLMVRSGWDRVAVLGGRLEAGAAAAAGAWVDGSSERPLADVVFAGITLVGPPFTSLPGLLFGPWVDRARIFDGPVWGVSVLGFAPEFADDSGNLVVCSQISSEPERAALGCPTLPAVPALGPRPAAGLVGALAALAVAALGRSRPRRAAQAEPRQVR